MGRVRSAIRWRGLWALPRTLLRGSLRREARQSLIALMRPSCVCATNSLTGGRAVKVNEGGSFHLLVALRHQTWCRAVFIAGISGIGEYPRTRSEEHTSELQSLMRISYAVFCLKKNKTKKQITNHQNLE